jgi:hypothetical protein
MFHPFLQLCTPVSVRLEESCTIIDWDFLFPFVVFSPSPLSFFQVHMLFVICALSRFIRWVPVSVHCLPVWVLCPGTWQSEKLLFRVGRIQSVSSAIGKNDWWFVLHKFLHFWMFGCWFTLNKFLALLDVRRLKETERLLLQKMGGQWWWTKVVGKKIQMRVGFQLELWM